MDESVFGTRIIFFFDIEIETVVLVLDGAVVNEYVSATSINVETIILVARGRVLDEPVAV